MCMCVCVRVCAYVYVYVCVCVCVGGNVTHTVELTCKGQHGVDSQTVIVRYRQGHVLEACVRMSAFDLHAEMMLVRTDGKRHENTG